VVTASVYFTGVSPSPNVLFYIWSSLFVFYFFNRRQATYYVLLTGICYGAALAFVELLFPPVATWLIVVGTVAVAGFFVDSLKTRLHEVIAQLAKAARCDPLTDLLNRRGFGEQFEHELERARRNGRPLSVAVLDIDQFKQINDRRGHGGGDEVLKQVAAAIDAAKRAVDIPARLGGDEFAILLPDTDANGASALTERVRDFIRKDSGIGEVLTVSSGVATFPFHGDGPDRVLAAADRALYGAKAMGRDRSLAYSVGSALFENVPARLVGTS
jgi:diguanylate cyclase (GGDEF)-like protein